MSFVTAAPEMLATAAQNVANIGTSLSAANATAAASTTSVLAAGADEVSQAIARLFSDYATHYQSLNAQAAAFHHSFVQTLNAAGGAYSSAEAANASAQALEQNLLAVINAPAQALFAGIAGSRVRVRHGNASTQHQHRNHCGYVQSGE